MTLRRLALVLGVLALAAPGRAQEEATPDLLGMGGGAAGHREVGGGAGGPAPGPWDRLPPPVRADLARVLDAQLAEGLAAHNHGSVLEAWRAAGSPGSWPRYFFEEGMSAEGRRGLVGLHAKLAGEGLWHLIGALGWIDRQGDTGFMFLPATQDMKAQLRRAGYGDYWFASRGGPWGVRSPETGAQLHFRESDPGTFRLFSVHVDLNNPGSGSTSGLDPAIDLGEAAYHWWEDDRNRGRTHDPDSVRAALVAQGLAVPEVDNAPYDGLWLTSFLKWETDEEDWFGHLWLRPADLRAGWWTEDEGARDFTRVTRLPADAPGAPRFQLDYPNGWVRLTIGAGGQLEATWFQAHTRRVRRFSGELERGNVERP